MVHRVRCWSTGGLNNHLVHPLSSPSPSVSPPTPNTHGFLLWPTLWLAQVKLYATPAGKGQCDMMEVAALEPMNAMQRVNMRGGFDMRDVKCDLVQFADKDVLAKVGYPSIIRESTNHT